MPTGVTAAVHSSLYLHKSVSPRVRNGCRKGQIFVTAWPPQTVAQVPLAGLIPTLYEIVVNVDGAWADQFDGDFMILAFAAMAGSHHGVWIEIHAPYERNLGLLSGID